MSHAQMLPGMESIEREKGPNETAAIKAIQAMKEQGLLDATDIALETLLLSAAADVDGIKEDDAASGRASLLKTYLAVLNTLQNVIADRLALKRVAEEELTPDRNVLKIIND